VIANTGETHQRTAKHWGDTWGQNEYIQTRLCSGGNSNPWSPM